MESLLLKYPRFYKFFIKEFHNQTENESIEFDDKNVYVTNCNGSYTIKTVSFEEIQGSIVGLTYPNGVCSLATLDPNEWEDTLIRYDSVLNSDNVRKKVVKEDNKGVVTKEVSIRKSSGFQISLSACIVNTPKGKVRTITIKDHEVLMADKPLAPPGDQMTIVCNDMDLDTNKQQIKEFCEFLLKELK